ncbi:MAG: hypothetical protein ISS16_07475 [Ignavibacteria bacterium]|nr:hypothetical protein [Ignavibacteria bacterium]
MKRIIIFIVLFLFSFSCNELSTGQKRRKLEFLYKLNNEASVLRDYTYRIFSYEDLDFYKGRLESSEKSANNIEPVANWEKSNELKSLFLEKIKENAEITESLLSDKENLLEKDIAAEKRVIGMKMIMDSFVDYIYKEISVVDKE